MWRGANELNQNPVGSDSLAANELFWDYTSATLYLNIGRDPTGEAIEAASSTNCVVLEVGNRLAHPAQ